ncbi:hypothetical protein ZWY2020_051063 [Hordeum vulgare]|nr:hypothetical protein ZWY2020_051063 [Hordeum vulgare]
MSARRECHRLDANNAASKVSLTPTSPPLSSLTSVTHPHPDQGHHISSPLLRQGQLSLSPPDVVLINLLSSTTGSVHPLSDPDLQGKNFIHLRHLASRNIFNPNQRGTEEERYRSDDSIASMLGEKLGNFISAYKADIAQVAPPLKPSSPEEILDALNSIGGLDDDALLEAYDILIADDRKFKALMALPERMKKKWILKQINQWRYVACSVIS